MRYVNGVICIDHQGDEVFHLLFVGGKEFLKGGKIFHRRGLRTDLHPVVHTAGEYQFQRSAHIEERRVVPTFRLMRRLRFHTADDVVIARFFHRLAVGKQLRDDDFVVVIRRQTDARSGQFRRFNEEFVRTAVPHAHRQRRLRQVDVHRRFNAHKGEVVGGIQTIGILTAANEVLEHTVAGKTLRRGGIAAFVQIIEFDPDTIDQFLCGFHREFAAFDIRFIIREHILVEATGRNGVAGGLHLDELLHKPEGLARFVETRRTVGRHTVAVAGDLFQFETTGDVDLTLRHLARQFGIAGRILADRIATENDRV